MKMEIGERPWGKYWVLGEHDSHKVKRIEVNPGGVLSLQYHQHRAEVWTIVSGTGKVTLGDDIQDFKVGEVVQIPQGVVHRIENRSNELLVFIEVQFGTYFGEDDIVRVEDIYARR